MRLGGSSLIPHLGFRCGSAFSVGALDLRWISVFRAARRVQWVRRILRRIRRTMRLGVSCLMHELGVTCGSAFSVGALDLRRISVSGAARRLQFVTSSRLSVACHWIYMQLGVAWASSVTCY